MEADGKGEREQGNQAAIPPSNSLLTQLERRRTDQSDDGGGQARRAFGDAAQPPAPLHQIASEEGDGHGLTAERRRPQDQEGQGHGRESGSACLGHP